MGTSFAEKFEEALDEMRRQRPGYGLRTLARDLADGDPEKIETIRRRLNKYRPKGPSGAAEVSPTAPTRHEIEDAMGLDRDSLKPEQDAVAAYGATLVGDLLGRFIDERIAAAHARAALKRNDQVAHLRGERDLVATTTEVTDDGGTDARR